MLVGSQKKALQPASLDHIPVMEEEDQPQNQQVGLENQIRGSWVTPTHPSRAPKSSKTLANNRAHDPCSSRVPGDLMAFLLLRCPQVKGRFPGRPPTAQTWHKMPQRSRGYVGPRLLSLERPVCKVIIH